jgi:cell division protein ZapA
MAQLTIEVNGKSYVVGCEDGQEDHLRSLAALIDAKMREMAPGAGQLGETRLMLLGALMIADERGDAKAELSAAQARIGELEDELARADVRAAAALEAAAQKLEAMAAA